MTPETLAFLRERFAAIYRRMDAFEERLSVLETVTGDHQSELDEINERANEDGYLTKRERHDQE